MGSTVAVVAVSCEEKRKFRAIVLTRTVAERAFSAAPLEPLNHAFLDCGEQLAVHFGWQGVVQQNVWLLAFHLWTHTKRDHYIAVDTIIL